MSSFTINLRRRYDLYLTNTKDNSHGAGPYTLLYPTTPSFRGTPRQIVAEIAEFQRVSGGCFIGVKVVDPRTGEECGRDTIREAVWLADCR